MTEYIEREKVIQLVDDIMEDCKVVHKHRAIRRNIKQMPHSNVVEVVRCKSCKYYKKDTDYCKEHNKGYCEFDNTIKSKNHFCSYGVKKDGKEDEGK